MNGSDPTPDDLLEAARAGEDISRPHEVGPAIGGQHIVREDVPAARPVGNLPLRCGTCGVFTRSRTHAVWGTYCERALLLPVDPDEWAEIGEAQAAWLKAAMHETRFHKVLEWGPNEWRQIPGFPAYEMNGYYREVRRRATTRKDGTVKPARPVIARKSSVTLSQDGTVTSHGIEKLWRWTFPDYVVREESWQVHNLRRESIPEGLGRVVETPW